MIPEVCIHSQFPNQRHAGHRFTAISQASSIILPITPKFTAPYMSTLSKEFNEIGRRRGRRKEEGEEASSQRELLHSLLLTS